MSSVFISHSSASAAAAARIERAFAQAGLSTWLDNSDLGLGILLRNGLTEAIQQSSAVVLVWSKPASRSRWVSAEILTAFHVNRFILPCVTDDAPLPQFLIRSAYMDLRRPGRKIFGVWCARPRRPPPSQTRCPRASRRRAAN